MRRRPEIATCVHVLYCAIKIVGRTFLLGVPDIVCSAWQGRMWRSRQSSRALPLYSRLRCVVLCSVAAAPPARAQSEIRPILDSFAESSAYIIHFRLAVRPNRMTQQQTEYNAVHAHSTYASPDWVHVLYVVGMQDEADLN
jgi:hypothetical protein